MNSRLGIKRAWLDIVSAGTSHFELGGASFGVQIADASSLRSNDSAYPVTMVGWAGQWNFDDRSAYLGMRLFGSAVIALIVLWFVDMEFNHGR